MVCPLRSGVARSSKFTKRDNGLGHDETLLAQVIYQLTTRPTAAPLQDLSASAYAPHLDNSDGEARM